jgi:hypothetical protein
VQDVDRINWQKNDSRFDENSTEFKQHGLIMKRHLIKFSIKLDRKVNRTDRSEK